MPYTEVQVTMCCPVQQTPLAMLYNCRLRMPSATAQSHSWCSSRMMREWLELLT